MADVPVPQIQFSIKDTEYMLDNLAQILPGLTNNQWTDYTPNDVGDACITTMAALVNKCQMHVDQQASDTFVQTAFTREGMIQRANSAGYVPGSVQPAVLTAQINFPVFNTQIEIPAGSVWQVGTQIFTCLSPLIVPAGQTGMLITLTQGSLYQYSISTPIQPWSRFVIPNNATNIQVTVDSVPWTVVTSFLDLPAPTIVKIYEGTAGNLICFGPGTSEIQLPPTGSTVLVSCLLTDGASGSVPQSGLPVTPKTPIVTPGNVDVTMAFSGTNTTAGFGADPESMDSMRVNIPKGIAAQDRCVRLSDFEVVVARVPGVMGYKVIGGETIGRKGDVIIIAYGESPYTVSTDLLNAVAQEVADVGVLQCISVYVYPPVVVQVSQAIGLGIDRTVFTNPSTSTMAALSAISDLFVEIGINDNVYDSQEDAALVSIPGVIYSDISSTVAQQGTPNNGLISIPLIANYDVSNAVLKDANGNTIWSGNGASKVVAGTFNYTITGSPVSPYTLSYLAANQDIVTTYQQLCVPQNISVTPAFVN